MKIKNIKIFNGTSWEICSFGFEGAIQNIGAEAGLKATRTDNDVTVGFDDEVIFILDCGTATEDSSTFILQDNAAGGQTAIIG